VKRLKILIVDDREANLLALGSVLSVLDVDVLKAKSGDEALRLALEHQFALAILDVQMPSMNGYELADLLRGDQNTRLLPVIFLSAVYGDEEHQFQGYRSGAVDFITKPFNPGILLAKVRIFLSLHQQSEELAGHKQRLEQLLEAQQQTNALLAEEIERRKKSEARLQELATTDGLTGLFNRRHFLELLHVEFDRAKRYGAPLSYMMMDADHFKTVNDTFGHETGDRVLCMLADGIRKRLRGVDFAGRLGGEEFAVVMPETELEGALRLAQDIREAVESAAVSVGQGVCRITVSIGLSSLGPDMEDMGALMRSADDALYRAKDSGRNAVVCTGLAGPE